MVEIVLGTLFDHFFMGTDGTVVFLVLGLVVTKR